MVYQWQLEVTISNHILGYLPDSYSKLPIPSGSGIFLHILSHEMCYESVDDRD